VRHHDDAGTAAGSRPERADHPIGVSWGQRGRRLVDHENAGASVHDPGHGNQGLLARGEICEQSVRRHLQAHEAQCPLCNLSFCAEVEDRAEQSFGGHTEAEILRDGQPVHEPQVLMDEGDVV
jgi:hypothetical protein